MKFVKTNGNLINFVNQVRKKKEEPYIRNKPSKEKFKYSGRLKGKIKNMEERECDVKTDYNKKR